MGIRQSGCARIGPISPWRHAEKHGGFGLEHTFCKDEHASRAAHMLMQLAHNLWQVFES